jgi:hypothetical protein
VALLKQRVVHNDLPESINTLQIPPPSSFHTSSDKESHQYLSNRYVKIIDQAKSDMMSVYIATAEAYMHECQVKFDTQLAQMKEDQHSGPTERRMSQQMIKAMKRRYKNLTDHFQYLHDLKVCVFTKNPAVKTTTKQTV